MLGQIANFCPVVSRNSITKNSTSLAKIWHTIRLHFGFQSSGAHLLDFAAIRRENDERPEDLFQSLMAFTKDNLLRSDGGISHQGLLPLVDEDMSPTLENFVTLHWLTLLHLSLPTLVKQRYGPELRNLTIASLKPEISQSIPSLMAELQSTEDAHVLRAYFLFPDGNHKQVSVHLSLCSCPSVRVCFRVHVHVRLSASVRP